MVFNGEDKSKNRLVTHGVRQKIIAGMAAIALAASGIFIGIVGASADGADAKSTQESSSSAVTSALKAGATNKSAASKTSASDPEASTPTDADDSAKQTDSSSSKSESGSSQSPDAPESAKSESASNASEISGPSEEAAKSSGGSDNSQNSSPSAAPSSESATPSAAGKAAITAAADPLPTFKCAAGDIYSMQNNGNLKYINEAGVVSDFYTTTADGTGGVSENGLGIGEGRTSAFWYERAGNNSRDISFFVKYAAGTVTKIANSGFSTNSSSSLVTGAMSPTGEFLFGKFES